VTRVKATLLAILMACGTHRARPPTSSSAQYPNVLPMETSVVAGTDCMVLAHDPGLGVFVAVRSQSGFLDWRLVPRSVGVESIASRDGFAAVVPDDDQSAQVTVANYSWRCARSEISVTMQGEYTSSLERTRLAKVGNRLRLFGFSPTCDRECARLAAAGHNAQDQRLHLVGRLRGTSWEAYRGSDGSVLWIRAGAREASSTLLSTPPAWSATSAESRCEATLVDGDSTAPRSTQRAAMILEVCQTASGATMALGWFAVVGDSLQHIDGLGPFGVGQSALAFYPDPRPVSHYRDDGRWVLGARSGSRIDVVEFSQSGVRVGFHVSASGGAFGVVPTDFPDSAGLVVNDSVVPVRLSPLRASTKRR